MESNMISNNYRKKYVVHCKRSMYDVYIGRKSRGAPKNVTSFEWGNPFVMKNASQSERERVVEEYRQWILSQPAMVAKARTELRGKVLGCWCSPKLCHGSVLAEIANSNSTSSSSTDEVENQEWVVVADEDEQQGEERHHHNQDAVQTTTMDVSSSPSLQQRYGGYVVHCKRASYDVYIGRKSKGAPRHVTSFEWGNPFIMKDETEQERRRVVQKYCQWITSNPELVAKAKRELRGKVLACWCSPRLCHGHVLAWIANSPDQTTVTPPVAQHASQKAPPHPMRTLIPKKAEAPAMPPNSGPSWAAITKPKK